MKNRSAIGRLFLHATGLLLFACRTHAGVVPADNPAFAFRGCHSIEQAATGVRFARFRPDVLERPMSELGLNPAKAGNDSGITIVFRTDSPRVKARFKILSSNYMGSGFGVFENGVLVREFKFTPKQEDAVLEFESTREGASLFEVVLPSFADVEFSGLELEDGYALSNSGKLKNPVYIALGDSISHGVGQDGYGHKTWPFLLSKNLGLELFNLAVGGAKVSVPVGEMLEDWERIDLITILVGYNDLHFEGKTPAAYRQKYSELLDAIRKNHPETRVLCITPLYTKKPVSEKTGINIQQFRDVLSDLVSERRETDENLFLIQGDAITSEENLRADHPSDPVHLSIPGAALFADRLMSTAAQQVPGIFGSDQADHAERLPEESKSFRISVDPVTNGTFQVSPSIPENEHVPAGTVLTLKAVPDPDYLIDSVYCSFIGFKGWTEYAESMASEFVVTVDRDLHIGASFIEQSAVEGFAVIQDVVYAKPGVKPLKYDVYRPDGAESLPCIVIIHGGGWSANNEDIMRGLARELVRSGDYVVFSVDYRWLNKRDGDKIPNTMIDLIEDVFGALAHIQEHAEDYGADPTRIVVTGDSAGGHLSAAAANMAGMIGDGGFGVNENVYQYRPTYMPDGKSVKQVREEIARAIRAAAPSYGVFDGFERMAEGRSEAWRKALCPIETIPDAKDRLVPHFLLRGTRDWIKHENVQAYADALRAAGQPVEYVQVEGARHAFLDWKPDPHTKAAFRKYGLASAAKMKAFFDAVFDADRAGL